MNRHNHGSVATYVIIALILAVITYVEFAIVEYDIAWLSRNAVMFWLIALSVVKFLLVIMFFMHLKGDDKTYSGFFTSGMVMAMGTFIGLAMLFTVTSVSNYTFTNETPGGLEHVAEHGDAHAPVDQSQAVVPPEAGDEGDFAVGEEGAATVAGGFDAAAAEAVFTANCASCHQAGGTGLPGVFPPFAEGHAADIYNADGGREVLLHTVLFGMQGEIEVHGSTYNGAMPAWPQLSDGDIALVLNHITNAWGNDAQLVDFQAYTADEVAAERDAGLSGSDVHAARVALSLAGGAAPAAEAEEAPAAEEEAAEEEPAAEEAAAEDEAEEAAETEEVEEEADAEDEAAADEEAEEADAEEAADEAAAEDEAEEAEAEAEEAADEAAATDEDVADADESEVEEAAGEEAEEAAAAADEADADADEEVAAAADEADEADADEATEDEAEEVEEEDAVEAAPAAAAGADFDRDAAEAAYTTNCSTCHNPAGVGIPSVFPPLAGHANELYNADGGREYLTHVLLYGVTGQITVDGMSYSGAMPAWQQLDDETLANVYNHIVTAWGNEDDLNDFVPMTADEIAAQRGLDLSTGDVYEQRGALGLD